MKQADEESRRHLIKLSSMLGLAYPKLIHYNRLPKGTHFAAWEQPEFFVAELRTAFKSLR